MTSSACFPEPDLLIESDRADPALPARLAVLASDRAEAVRLLVARNPERVLSGVAARLDPPVAFLFPGYGTQYLGMGRELYDAIALVREVVDRCAEHLRPRLGIDLREVMFATGGDLDVAGQRLLRP